MKHICNCRACDSVPELAAGRTGEQEWWRYGCECGVSGALAFTLKGARGQWNANNAEAQNTKRLTDAVVYLALQLEDKDQE